MEDTRPTILIVDDEQHIVDLVKEFLSGRNYECTGFVNPRDAIAHLENHTFDLVLTDMKMGAISGMDVLRAVKKPDPYGTMVIMMTSYPTVEGAIDAMRSGVENYVLKPFSLDSLEHVVKLSLEKQNLARENVNLKESLALYRASEALEAPLELTEYLEMVLNIAVGELGGHSAHLVLFTGPQESRKVDERIDVNPSMDTDSLVDDAMIQLASTLENESGSIVITDYENHGPLMALPLRAGGDLVGLLAVQRKPTSPKFTPAQAKALSIIGSGAAVAVKNARLYNSLQEQYLGAIRALVTAVEAKDPYTRGHSEKTAYYAQMIAREINAGQDIEDGMRVAGLLHDAGKIGVPEAILLKQGPLTDEEYKIIKGHVLISARIAEPLPLPENVLHAISEHHEMLDGSGYPVGLAGDEISLSSRLIAVVDIYDALTSDRVYRERTSSEDAFGELDIMVREGKIDGDLVEILRKLVVEGRLGKDGPFPSSLLSIE